MTLFKHCGQAFLALCLSLTVSVQVAAAAALPEPEGQVLLEVSGAILNKNDPVAGTAQFDEAMLRDLDWREVETFTSFTSGPQRMAGPTLASLLVAVGATGQRLHATAINDYFVEIPVAHARMHKVLLVLEMNGNRMRIRDKGPIWVVYPLSEDETRSKPFDTEMIWQLNRIDVLN